jgi:hypothetical protein
MSFLSSLVSAAWGGATGAGESVGRQIDDLGHGDFSSANNETENTFNSLSEIPATDFANLRALYDGANGDLSWNPYAEGNSVLDRGAGGKASEDPNNRKWGRLIGTLIGSYFTGGALGSAMGSSTGGAAASGALWGAGQAAGAGGDRDQIGKSALYGTLGGMGSGWIDGADAAGQIGVENAIGRGIINRGLGSGITTAMQPGADSTDIVRSAGLGGLYGGIQGAGTMYSNNEANPYAMEFSNNTNTFETPNQSKAPWATPNAGLSSIGVSTPQMSYAPTSPNFTGYQEGNSFATPPNTQQPSLFDRVSEILGGRVGGSNFSQLGGYAEGLAGLYSNYRQRRQASKLMDMVSGRRGAYESTLRDKLMARDAAAGRRSNYSGRETQLQGALAELDSRNAPTMMALDNRIHDGTVGMLQSGLRMGSRAGWFNPRFDSSPMSVPSSLSQLDMPQVNSLQNQIDPMNWERIRRANQFGA